MTGFWPTTGVIMLCLGQSSGQCIYMLSLREPQVGHSVVARESYVEIEAQGKRSQHDSWGE